MTIPIVSAFGEEGMWWDRNFRLSLNRLMLSRTQNRSLIFAWLWSIALPEKVFPRNPYVEAAERLFEERMENGIQVAEAARELFISPSQLTRLFLAEHGRTPLQYLLEQRAGRAHHLLTQTTLPIKAVASACGVPNAHAFNRFVRARLGGSPRSIRLGTATVDAFRAATFGRFEEGSLLARLNGDRSTG
jgi:transcriptional regulator GlxA family with amidase domain